MHGGNNKVSRDKSSRLVAETDARRFLGFPLEVDPIEALLGQVWEAAGNVEFLRMQVQVDHENKTYALVPMYNEERDRLAKMSKLCLDAGVAEKQIRIMEVVGASVVSVIQSLLDFAPLKLTVEQKEQGRIFAGEQLKRLSAS